MIKLTSCGRPVSINPMSVKYVIINETTAELDGDKPCATCGQNVPKKFKIKSQISFADGAYINCDQSVGEVHEMIKLGLDYDHKSKWD